MPKSRNLACLVLLAAAFTGLSAAPVQAAEVEFVRNATSEFDGYIASPTSRQQAWIQSHYRQMRGYPPFFDQALDWAPPTDFYQDLYALYPKLPADKKLIDEHPDWILRDASGKPLYIPWACGGGTCPALAADPANPAFRAEWVRRAAAKLAQGYAGVFIDNVVLEMNVGNGQGQQVRPIDRRTGAPMTDAAWSRYVAEFLEHIRSQLPTARITHNVRWWLPRSDPFVRRAALAADQIELERGFNDKGLTGGGGTFGYTTFLRYIDWLHRLGKDVVVEPYLANAREARYEVAGYFLTHRRGDRIATDYEADPPTDEGRPQWWRGWNTNLGRARGHRRMRGGLWRRKYSRARVIVNPPDGRPRRIRFHRPKTNLAGKTGRRFRLGPREGDVFFRHRKVFRAALRG